MTKETLVQALQAEGLKVANDSVSIPEARDATFMVAGPGETVQVAKVTKVELRESAICFETAKSERYWFTYDLVLGLRIRGAEAAKERKERAGFSR